MCLPGSKRCSGQQVLSCAEHAAGALAWPPLGGVTSLLAWNVPLTLRGRLSSNKQQIDMYQICMCLCLFPTGGLKSATGPARLVRLARSLSIMLRYYLTDRSQCRSCLPLAKELHRQQPYSQACLMAEGQAALHDFGHSTSVGSIYL